MNMDEILDEAIRLDASDVHLICDNRQMLRIARDLIPVENSEVLTPEDMNDIYDYLVKGNLEKDEVFNTRNIGLKLPDFLDELLNLHLSEDDIKFWKESKIDDSCNNLVHGDLNPSNVLLDDNNNVAAIIDFGFGGFGDKYDDISRIIGRCPERFKNGIVKSYESYSKAPVNMEILNDKIDKWNNIDKGYINYMRSIGIYE